MGLFRKAGKKFEETKRAFTDDEGVESNADDEATDYVCRSCEEAVPRDYEYCPHCGEEAVEQVA